MAYIKEKLSDIEKEFIPDYINMKNPLLDIFPELPLCIEVIQNCVTFYSIEGFEEEIEKREILAREYNPKNSSHSFKLDYDKLSQVLNYGVFKDELFEIIEAQEAEFKADLDKLLSSSTSDISFKINLRECIQMLNQSMGSLGSITVNRVQKVAVDLYRKSYVRVLKELKVKYQEFAPELFIAQDSTDKEDFKRYFENPSAVQKLIVFEKKLQDKGYLNEDLVWQKDKIDLVKFFLFCVNKEMIKKIFAQKTDVLRFFEERYSIELGDQKKPSKFKKLKNYRAEFYFLQ
ncbi:hypothetical protein LZZ90_00710 [Flavobacterium sp. SM15]|uniref:hypothetical protein n=1 Tax=Flavobacterium sp. SM15 TaxID=2908005 RepID=UPI001EDBD1B0|nr:hypothetical protein [Flavobacterium sp. SM15]MCG2610023.1 hypothetical protein [Flavobacterium sp. SM15]